MSVGMGGRRRWRRPTILFAVCSGAIALLLLGRVLAGGNDRPSDSLPGWSPDGGSITFSSNRDGYLDVFVMHSDGSGLTQLTSDPFSFTYFLRSPTDAWSRWSPDGRHIAFASGRDNRYMASVGMNIYLMDADGTNVKRLTASVGGSNQPAWSPDGRRIAFASDRDFDWDIYVMDSDGSKVIRLTETKGADDQPAWAPDGSRIAFTSNRDGNTDIYAMDATGRNVVRLTKGPNRVFSVMPNWSPDGRRIAFASNRDGDVEIYLMDPGGSNIVQLTTTGGNTMPSWSPDGKKIAFVSDRDGHIYALAVDGSNIARLTKD